jgi:hypothetical protein
MALVSRERSVATRGGRRKRQAVGCWFLAVGFHAHAFSRLLEIGHFPARGGQAKFSQIAQTALLPISGQRSPIFPRHFSRVQHYPGTTKEIGDTGRGIICPERPHQR